MQSLYEILCRETWRLKYGFLTYLNVISLRAPQTFPPLISSFWFKPVNQQIDIDTLCNFILCLHNDLETGLANIFLPSPHETLLLHSFSFPVYKVIAIDRMFVLHRIHLLNGTSALIKQIPKNSFNLSAMLRTCREDSHLWSRKSFPPDAGSVSILILDAPGSITMRNKCLLFITYPDCGVFFFNSSWTKTILLLKF